MRDDIASYIMTLSDSLSAWEIGHSLIKLEWLISYDFQVSEYSNLSVFFQFFHPAVVELLY